jgi:uncharacterized protein (TIGR02217 family)
MTFYAEEIDACPAYGWQGGPTSDVLIRMLRNRHERRNKRGDLMQHSYTLPFQNITSLEYFEHIKSAFMAMGGPHDSFLAKDYWDRTAVAQPFGIGDGSTQVFYLSKRYTFGSAFYDRPITKPVAGAIVYLDGSPTDVVPDPLTGEVDFGDETPGIGAVLTWTGEFRVPVRFADFSLMPSIDNRSGDAYIMNGSCSLIEVFGE